MNSLQIEMPSRIGYFATLVAEDRGLPLMEAAVAVGQDDDPEMDPQSVLLELDDLGRRLAQRVPADAPPLQRLRMLNRYVFDDLGFAGNVNDYYDPDNSFIHRVLQSRRGIPITLALIYGELASHVRLTTHGIGFPGHFLVKVSLPRGEVVIDPFNGRSLSREELQERLTPYLQARGLTDDFEVPLGLFLQASAPRDTLARLLRNLKDIHITAQRWDRLLCVQDRLVTLLPQVIEERRDRGLALAEMGLIQAAAIDIEAYLAERGDADDAPALRMRLRDFERRGRPRT